MGFNTNITILNDGFSELERFPDDFVEGIAHHLHDGGTFGVGDHCNVVQVQPSEHADAIQLIAMGGNFSTKVHTAWCGLSHHTEDGQVAILRSWANKLGYRIAKKPVS